MESYSRGLFGIVKGRTGRREGEVRNQCPEVRPIAEDPQRGLRRQEYAVVEAEADRPPQGPDRPLGLVLGRPCGLATAKNLVAEGVPAGRGEPVERLTRIERLEIAGRCIQRGRFLEPVPATTGSRQLDPTE